MIKDVMTAAACVFCFVAAQAADPDTAAEYWVSADGPTNAAFTAADPGRLENLGAAMAKNRSRGKPVPEAEMIVFKEGVYRLTGTNAVVSFGRPYGWKGLAYFEFDTAKRLTLRSETGCRERTVLEGDPGVKVRALTAGGKICLEGLLFRGFSADACGGAIQLGGGTKTSLNVTNCVFAYCSAGEDGGAANGGSYVDTLFLGNRAGRQAGAVMRGDSFVNCQFEKNVALDSAGACSQWTGAFTNCLFQGNLAVKGAAGALWGTDGNWRKPWVVLSRCTFTGNRASVYEPFERDQTSIAGWTVMDGCEIRDWSEATYGKCPSKKSPYVNFLTVKPGDDLIAVRDTLRENRDPAVWAEVVFEDGIYVLTNAVFLSGRDGKSIWRARNPGKAVITGGLNFRGAEANKVTDDALLKRLKPEARKAVRAFAVPDALTEYFQKGGMGKSDGKWGDRQYENKSYGWSEKLAVFAIDGAMQTQARWPNKGWSQLEGTNFVKKYERKDKDQTILYRTGYERTKNWNFENGDIYIAGWAGNCGWTNQRLELTKYNPETDTVTAQVRHFTQTAVPGGRVYYHNIMEELDEPGEWCYDRVSKQLVFWPPKRFSKKSLLSVGVLPEPFFHVRGSDITLEGFRFTAKLGLPAIVLDKGRGAQVIGCSFSAMMAGLASTAFAATVRSCDFFDIGGHAVRIQSGDRLNQIPGRNLVENCHIWNTGLFDGCATALEVFGVENTARKNLIHDLMGHAIDYGGDGGVIEYNRIYNATYEETDSGAVYAPGMYASYGCTLRFNDVGGAPGYCNGIYLDDQTSGHTVYGNIIRGFGYYGLFCGGGRDCVVSNNIFTAGWGGMLWDSRGRHWPGHKQSTTNGQFYASWLKQYCCMNPAVLAKYPRLAKWNEDGESANGPLDNVIVNNLIFDIGDQGTPLSLDGLLDKSLPTGRYTVANNLYVRTIGSTTTNDANRLKWTLPGWRQLDGTPSEPIDLGFVDYREPETTHPYPNNPKKSLYAFRLGDMNLKKNARLFKEIPGFQPIPFTEIGLYKDEWRAKIE